MATVARTELVIGAAWLVALFSLVIVFCCARASAESVIPAVLGWAPRRAA